MTRTGLTDHNVVGLFASMEQARAGVSGLGRAGVEADHVSLLGRRAEEAARNPDTSQADQRVTGDIARKAGTGAAAGVVAGGLAGLAAFTIPGVGPVVGSGIWAATGAGALAGGAVGGFVGGVASIDLADDWELTYQSVREGRVLVAVHADDSSEGDRAAAALERAGAEMVLHFDADGRLRPA